MPWVKGQSGNPTGRAPGDAQVKTLARQHTEAAITALVRALKAKSERTRVAAAEALLNRGWGQPRQEHDITLNLPAASADDAALLAVALGSGGVAVATAGGTEKPSGVVH